jgi:hypothetical protein
MVSEVILAGGFGLLLLAMPQWLLTVLGIAPAPVPQLLARLFGTALIHVAFLHGWQGRIRSAPAMRGLAWANILQDTLAAAVLFIGTAQGTVNALGWGLVAVFAGVAACNGLALRAMHRESRRLPEIPTDLSSDE